MHQSMQFDRKMNAFKDFRGDKMLGLTSVIGNVGQASKSCPILTCSIMIAFGDIVCTMNSNCKIVLFGKRIFLPFI